MYKISSLIMTFSVISMLTAAPINFEKGTKNPKSKLTSTNIHLLQAEIAHNNCYRSCSLKQNTEVEIMGLAGSYFHVDDEKKRLDVMEQWVLIEEARKEVVLQKSEKKPSPLASKILKSQKVFGDSHIEAALSIGRVHSKYLETTIPGATLIGWGGRFMDKIHRFEMLFSIDEMPISNEMFAMMLFTLIEDINNHEERFAPYLATFPFSTEEYELRLMLPDYKKLSTKERPQPAFIFNIADTVFLCHREAKSGCLEVFKKEQFGDIIRQVNTKIEQEKAEKNSKQPRIE